MARPRNPLSPRNRNKSFTGAELQRLASSGALQPVALAASKRARVVRERGEFDIEDLTHLVRPSAIQQNAGLWTLDAIVDARVSQMAGKFYGPAQLAKAFGTDDALFVARGVRLAPVQSLGVSLTAGKGPKGAKVADEAEALFGVNGVAVSSATMTTIRSHLVDHGIAFGCISWSVRPDGTRFDPILNAWPIECVWWDQMRGCYVTRARRLESEPEPSADFVMPAIAMESPFEPIIHGDGRWVVFAKSELLPHQLDAALLPAAMVWARHAFALRDWSKGSASHGNPKVIGEMLDSVALSDENGDPTAEANAFLTLLQAIASQDSPFGIKPAGAKVEYLTNDSKAWEVWDRLTEKAEKAAARIYLGTDGVLGSQGGGPGVDIQALMGVATSKVQSDLGCIEAALQSGLIAPWCALNFGDDRNAPTRRYTFPDPDEAAVRKDFGERNAAFLAAVKAARDAGFTVTPEWVAAVASQYGVPVPVLAGAPVSNDTTQGVA